MTIRPQTAPVLLQDLVRYTPPHIKAFKDVSESHCEHVYSTATERSSLPGLDERPGKDKIWKAETLCQKCRIHLILSVDFEDTLEQACPCEEFPVHHFILDEQVESVRAHSFRFRCSSPMCRAKLFTQLRAPVLSHIDQWVLTDTFVLKQKWEKCMDREEAEPYTPTKALKTFRSYIRGALSSDTPKRVPVNNKYFMLSLGDDATILLSKLGFSFEPVKDEASYPCWRLPGPAPYLDEEQRMQLQDVFDELLVLMQQRPDAEKQKAEEPAYRPPPGFKDMERVLGCLDYDKYLTLTRGTQTVSQQLLKAYTNLGAIPDYADNLISYCFDRQHMFDPGNTTLYYQNLRDIAASRQSETLVQKASLLESQGYLTQAEIEQAYQSLGIQIESQSSLSDEDVLNLYQSRVPDLSKAEQARARAALFKISQARRSDLLKNASSDKIETYSQALAFLGAEHNTDDQYILTLAQLKAEDNAQNAQLVQDAVKKIGEYRNSDALLYGHDPSSAQSSMTLQQAWQLLGIENPDTIDDEGIGLSHQVAIQDAPERATEFNNALSVIAEHRHSQHLRYQLVSSTSPEAKSSTKTGSNQSEPRGLNNIGNTCYLNSLLQYLFTVEPVREMIENFNEYRQMLPDDDSSFEKKIADIKVDKDGVRRTQAFVDELGKLFHTLTTSRASCATPEVELARLTLEKAIPAATSEEGQQTVSSPLNDPKRRRSTMSGHTITLSKLRSGSVSNIATSPTLERKEPPEGTVPISPSKKSRTDSNVSTASTVIENGTIVEKHPVATPGSGFDNPIPSSRQEQKEQDNHQMDVDANENKTLAIERGAEPFMDQSNTTKQDQSEGLKGDPPPVPPRPTDKHQIEQYAMQQDVEEVMGNVFHQLQWAIKPQSITKDGNQEDIISRIFWGKSTRHSIFKDGKRETETTPFHNLIVYANEPGDMYDALSESLDREEVDDRAVYWTIDEAPPIMHFIVPRVLWDAEKNTEVRNTNQLKLDPHIYMDRFMSSEKMITKRKLFWRYRDELKKRRTEKGRLNPKGEDLSITDTLVTLGRFLKDVKEEPDVNIGLPVDDAPMHECIEATVSHVEAEMKRLDDEIFELQDRMKELFRIEGQHKYCLQAIFVHRGSASSGHWFTYMYDAKGSQWRKYNDEDVAIVDSTRVEAEVFSPDEKLRGAATVVVYAREEERDTLFEPVHRKPDPEPQPELSETSNRQLVKLSSNIPNPGASLSEKRSSWDKDRWDVADSNITW